MWKHLIRVNQYAGNDDNQVLRLSLRLSTQVCHLRVKWAGTGPNRVRGVRSRLFLWFPFSSAHFWVYRQMKMDQLQSNTNGCIHTENFMQYWKHDSLHAGFLRHLEQASWSR